MLNGLRVNELLLRLIIDALLVFFDAIEFDLVILIEGKSFGVCCFVLAGEKVFGVVCELASNG